MKTSDEITKAVHASIAKTILEGLDTEARDAILQQSIEASIGNYNFRREVEKVVAEKAMRVTAELVEREYWENRIANAIAAGFEDYLANLRKAIPGVVSLAVHGKDDGSGYSRQAAAILRCWPDPDKQKE